MGRIQVRNVITKSFACNQQQTIRKQAPSNWRTTFIVDTLGRDHVQERKDQNSRPMLQGVRCVFEGDLDQLAADTRSSLPCTRSDLVPSADTTHEVARLLSRAGNGSDDGLLEPLAPCSKAFRQVDCLVDVFRPWWSRSAVL